MNLSDSAGGATRGRNEPRRNELPPVPFPRTIVAGFTVFACLLLAAGMVYLTQSAVTVQLTNRDCPPIRVNEKTTVLAGSKLPDVIPTGVSVHMRVQPAKATIDASNVDTVRIELPESVSDFTILENMSITLDNLQILGNYTTVDLKTKPTHTMLISCGEQT